MVVCIKESQIKKSTFKSIMEGGHGQGIGFMRLFNLKIIYCQNFMFYNVSIKEITFTIMLRCCQPREDVWDSRANLCCDGETERWEARFQERLTLVLITIIHDLWLNNYRNRNLYYKVSRYWYFKISTKLFLENTKWQFQQHFVPIKRFILSIACITL